MHLSDIGNNQVFSRALSLTQDGVKMNKIKKLILDYERTKDAFQKLIVLGSIQNELEGLKKDLSKKIK